MAILGHPLPDRPDLPALPDAGLGPAHALIQWARHPDALPSPHRWWVVACDQLRWTPAALQAWAREAQQADPEASHWVLGQREGRHQPLGGFLPERLRPSIQASEATRLSDLVASLPHLALAWQGPGWSDLDTPEELRSWEASHRQSDEVV
jgi:molybdopterin-guanine dinucleotide biosynthesis protein A